MAKGPPGNTGYERSRHERCGRARLPRSRGLRRDNRLVLVYPAVLLAVAAASMVSGSPADAAGLARIVSPRATNGAETPRGRHAGDMSDTPVDEDDEFDPEQADPEILAFIESADELDGPPVTELAADVADVLGRAWATIEERMAAIPDNKLLATMLLVGRQARELQPDEPRQPQLHAASSLLSGLVGQRSYDR